MITRPQIIASAIDLFAQQGIRATSIAAIAERAGITDAGLLHHFPTKQTLVDTVLAEYGELMRSRFATLADKGGLAGIAGIAEWADMTNERPEMVRLLGLVSGEAASSDSPVHDFFKHSLADLGSVVSRLLREGIDRGEIRAEVNVHQEVQALLAHYLGGRLLWLYSGDRYPVSMGLHGYVAEMVRRIKAPRARRSAV